MYGKVEGLMSSFIPSHIRRQVRELFASSIILNFAMAMVSIFEPIFLYVFFSQRYSLNHSISYILYFYLIVYVAYLFSIPLGAKISKRLGYEYTIALGTIFTAVFYFFLFAVNLSAWYLAPAVIFYIISKMLYWPAYHGNFSKYSVDGEQGREISNLVVFEALVYILGPLIGGMLIQFMGFKALFILSAIIMVLSNVPMILTKEKFIPGDFSYKKSFKRLFAKSNLKKMVALCGYGEELLVLVIWPIFMYIVIDSYLQLGVITAIATFATTALFLYIGKITDKSNPKNILKLGAVLYFFGWLFRIFFRNIWGVFLIDTFSRITKQAIAVPILAQTYFKSRHSSEMEGVIAYEMSLVIGKIIAIVLAIALISVIGVSWNALFVLAGLMSLLYLLF